jgi:hypothetical protein
VVSLYPKEGSMIVYTGRNSQSLRIVHIFNKHIIEDVGIVERRHYTPLIIGALQEHMIELLITLKVLQKKKGREEIEKDFEYEDFHEMSNFSYKLNIFITALQEQDLPKKFVSIILEELIRELEEVNDKIREIAARK